MSKSVVVIGGGIVGLCCAYYLQKKGCAVTLIDKSSMNAGASYVNAGYLTPSHIIPLAAPGMISTGLRYMFNSASPFYIKPRLDKSFLQWGWAFKKSATAQKVTAAIPHIKAINLLSRDLYDAIQSSKELGAFHYERKGLLMLYQSEKEGDHEKETALRAQKIGLESELLDPAGIAKMEPNIAIKASGAVHYLCDGHTTPGDFMKKMTAYLKGNGVVIKQNESVEDFELSNGAIKKVRTDQSEYSADEVVLASGSWSALLAKKLGLKLLLQPGKGYRLDEEKPTGISMPALLLDAKMAVTPMKGHTRFAGTMEFSGINTKIRRERVDAIARGAQQFYTDLQISEETKTNAQCGLRPVSPDGLPYIGRTASVKNAVIATGHAMMGWSLGPATGLLVSELINGEQTSLDIAPYHPDRKF